MGTIAHSMIALAKSPGFSTNLLPLKSMDTESEIIVCQKLNLKCFVDPCSSASWKMFYLERPGHTLTISQITWNGHTRPKNLPEKYLTQSNTVLFSFAHNALNELDIAVSCADPYTPIFVNDHCSSDPRKRYNYSRVALVCLWRTNQATTLGICISFSVGILKIPRKF